MSPATVDVLFVLPERLRANADGVARRRSAGLSPVLRQTIAAMTGRFGSIERLQEGWLAVRPTAASGEPRPGVRVRVLPGFACADGGYWIASPNGKVESGPWWRLHPQAELAHLDRADAMSGGQARHLIRMLKAWRRTSGAALGSLALELLACEFLSVWLYRRRSALFYDWMVRDCFFWLAAEAGRTLSIPGTHEILAIDDAWRLQAEAAHAAAAAASDLEHDNRSDAALARWRAIFGPAFPDVPKPSAPTQTSSKRTGPTLLAVE